MPLNPKPKVSNERRIYDYEEKSDFRGMREEMQKMKHDYDLINDRFLEMRD